jgi:hypothetical protein
MHRMTAPRHLTVRGISEPLARALKAEARRRRASVNETVKDLLARALGVAAGAEPLDNGLGDLAGTWSAKELAEFERATRSFEEVDEELWR